MDRTIEYIIALIESEVKSARGLKRVYNGHPQNIPNDSLPAAIVRGTGMNSRILDIYRNEEIFNIQIIIMMDARSKMNAELEESTVEREVRKIMEERDVDNELKDDTIMAVVEKNLLYTKNYNVNVTIDNIQFGAGLDPTFASEFPGAFYGVMDITVQAVPHVVSSGATYIPDTFSATYALVNQIVGTTDGYSIASVPQQFGETGDAYSFTDPTVTLNSGYQWVTSPTFNGNSLSGTFGTVDIAVGRAVSGEVELIPTWAFDKGLQFDGSDDYVSVAHHSTLDLTTDMHWSTWIDTTSTALGVLSSQFNGNTNKRKWIAAINHGLGANKFYVYMEEDGVAGGNTKFYISSISINDGNRHRCAFSWTGGVLKLYVDGVEDTSPNKISDASFTSMQSLDPLFMVGGYTNNTGSVIATYDGKMDETCVWSSALTAAEESALYNSGNGLDPTTNSGSYTSSADLALYFNYNNNVNDQSTNSNDGTLNNFTGTYYVDFL